MDDLEGDADRESTATEAVDDLGLWFEEPDFTDDEQQDDEASEA